MRLPLELDLAGVGLCPLSQILHRQRPSGHIACGWPRGYRSRHCLDHNLRKNHEKNRRKKLMSPGKFCRERGSLWTLPRGVRLAPRSEGSCGGCRWPPGTWGYRQMSEAWSIFLVSWRWPIHCKQTTFLAHTTTTINTGHKYAADCQKIALSLLHHHGHWYLCQLYLRDCDPLIEKKPRTVRTPINMFTQRK